MIVSDSLFLFSEDVEDNNAVLEASKEWKVLVIDDEEDVHQITTLVLNDFAFEGHKLTFLHAYSGAEAKKIFDENDDIALALVDVVMESSHAGLDFIKYVREEKQNKNVRLILRTGQPGEAPEESVIRDYDINDYKNKTELTSIKLKTLLYSSLRSYRDICTIEQNNKSLERLISATSHFIECDTISQFASVILDQVAQIIGIDDSVIYCCAATNSLYNSGDAFNVVALSGEPEACEKDVKNKIPSDIVEELIKAHDEKRCIHGDDHFVGYFTIGKDMENLLFVGKPSHMFSHEHHLLELFANNIAIAYESIRLREMSRESQKELSYILGEAVEKRSKETGSHVKRVAHYCRLMARFYGLSDYDSEIIKLASPLHDIGKIAIPDAILNKPGKLDADEWAIMQTHAQVGYEILSQSKNDIVMAGARIAQQHHEKWDGTGYPNQLKEREISIEGRISAIADVFDALVSERCYKPAWPIEKAMDFFKSESGKHFEPKLVEILVDNLSDFIAIKNKYPDVQEQATVHSIERR